MLYSLEAHQFLTGFVDTGCREVKVGSSSSVSRYPLVANSRLVMQNTAVIQNKYARTLQTSRLGMAPTASSPAAIRQIFRMDRTVTA